MDNNTQNLLRDWHQLLKDGILTQEEFNLKKTALLGNNPVTELEQNIISQSENEPEAKQTELYTKTPEEQKSVTLENISGTFKAKEPNENLKKKKTPARSLALIVTILIIGVSVYVFLHSKNSNTDNNQSESIETTDVPIADIRKDEPPPTPPPGIAANFAGYYRGGMQSGYVGGTDNAECRIMEDGTATFHYALNAGNGNQEATERGHIIKEQGNYYLKTNTGYGKYDVHIEPDIVYIGNGSSWEAKMYLNGKHTSSKETPKQSTKDVQSLAATGDETKFIEDDPEERTNYESKIRGLFAAEDERIFSKIVSYFSADIEQYFDLKYPTRDRLQERYQRFWSITSDPKNTITNIEKKGNNTYVVTGNYEYFGLKSQTTTKRDIRTIFIFNNKGEIVSLSN